VREGDNFTATCTPTVETTWDPQHPTNPQDSTACYGDRFTFLYVDDVRTSHETHQGPPRPVKGIALLSDL
jgi:hypothetical protein